MTVVGIFLVSVGCFFVILGAAQIIANLVIALRPADDVPSRGFAAVDINAVAALVGVISKLPPFALIALVGLLLIAIGQRVLAGLQILSY